MGSSASTSQRSKVTVAEASVKIHRPSITSIAGTYDGIAAMEEAQKVAAAAVGDDDVITEEEPKQAEKAAAASAVKRLTREQKEFFVK